MFELSSHQIHHLVYHPSELLLKIKSKNKNKNNNKNKIGVIIGEDKSKEDAVMGLKWTNSTTKIEIGECDK